MKNLDRTRLIFIAIVGLAVVIVICGLGYNTISRMLSQTANQPTATAARPAAATSTPVVAEITSPDPVFASDYKAGDGLPIYVCGADAFGSYFVLQQMQMSGKDVAHGFHLGIVPFLLDENPKYDISEEQRTALLEQGKWDCLLTTLDSLSLNSSGILTAIVDESAGADQLWVRNIATINDLKGKRITFSRGSVGEYFVYYALSIARLNPRFDVTLVPEDTVTKAVETFNAGQADAVSGWEPDIEEAKTGGGTPLLSSAQLRIIMDVIVTSRQSVSGKPDLVQAFHDAWFETLKAQIEDIDTSAKQIASWGHNSWSFVNPDTAKDDLTLWLANVAQADLGDNSYVMRDPTLLVKKLDIARRVWAASGAQVPSDDVSNLINTGFVSRSAAQPSLQANGNPINDTFSLSTRFDLSNVNTDDAATLAVLPCRRFTFLPESTELTLESRRILDDCVLPTLSQSVGLFLKVEGSAAWPGPKGTYTQADIQSFAEARAQSVVDYLVSQGIDKARFVITVKLPPESHWETEDPDVQAEDRYVEMTLITVGR